MISSSIRLSFTGRAGGLDDEDVRAPDVLVDLDEDLAVREPGDLRVAERAPGGTAAISSASARFALPENSFSSYGMARTPRGPVAVPALIGLVGAGGFEPPNTGSKVPRLAAWPRPIDPAPDYRAPFPRIRTAGPRSVRTAQHSHEPRATRAWIWRACSSDRATPNTVGPLPDIAAPSAPAATRAACMLADLRIRGPGGDLEPIVEGPRPRGPIAGSRARRPPRAPGRRPSTSPGVTRPYMSAVLTREARIDQHQRQRRAAERPQLLAAARGQRRPTPQEERHVHAQPDRPAPPAARPASAAPTAGSAPPGWPPHRSSHPPVPPRRGSACRA